MITNPTTNARKTDPISSHIAGHRVEKSGLASSNRGIVLGLVRANPGLTSLQLADKTTEIDRHEIARRLPELRARKQVYVSGFGDGKQMQWSALDV